MSTGSASLHLEVISGHAAGATIIVEDELVIGRHATEGILSADPEISRQHARISREATGEYAIEDLGSSNGTFVNGLRIQSPRLLSLGDSIETGATTLVVKEVLQPGASKTAIAAVPDAPPDQRHAPTTFTHTPPVPVPLPTPPLELELEVDFDARTARIALGDGVALDLAFADGSWGRPGEAGPADR
jgi:hypothetical protein